MSSQEKETIRNIYRESSYVHKDKKTILIKNADLEFYLNKGWVLGKCAYSEERNSNVSKGKKGKIAVTNYVHTKYIDKEDFPLYESKGYIKGNLTNIKRQQEVKLKRTQGELLETPEDLSTETEVERPDGIVKKLDL